MDERNERLVVDRIVKSCCTDNGIASKKTLSTSQNALLELQTHKPQYFLVSPKLLQALRAIDHPDVTVLMVWNGPGVTDNKWQLKDMVHLLKDECKRKGVNIEDIEFSDDEGVHGEGPSASKKSKSSSPLVVKSNPTNIKASKDKQLNAIPIPNSLPVAASKTSASVTSNTTLPSKGTNNSNIHATLNVSKPDLKASGKSPVSITNTTSGSIKLIDSASKPTGSSSIVNSLNAQKNNHLISNIISVNSISSNSTAATVVAKPNPFTIAARKGSGAIVDLSIDESDDEVVEIVRPSKFQKTK